MEITYPFARVVTVSTNNAQRVFPARRRAFLFQQLANTETGIVVSASLISECRINTGTGNHVISNAHFKDIQAGFYEAVELLKENTAMRTFYKQ
jgi:hypothetical protein